MPSFENDAVMAPDQLPGGPIREPSVYALTIDADQGRILKFEKVDSNGIHRELSDQEQAALVQLDAGSTLRALIERAFEAGINCLLDGSNEQDDAEESREAVDLRRALLQSLMNQTEAAALLQDKALGTAIVRTAFEQTHTATG